MAGHSEGALAVAQAVAGGAPDGDDAHVGETFGRYRVEARLGEGQGSRVYLARHPRTKREVAAHVFLPAVAVDRAKVERFFEEAQAVAEARHPGILETLDVGFAADGSPFQVVDFVKGKTLEELLEPGVPFAIPRALAIASQIATAVAAAHDWGMAHIALSPKNVFIGDDDKVKIGGFGLARIEAFGNPNTKGPYFGVADYVAPEQVELPGSADTRADIYSVGALLYAMLTGASPFAKVPKTELLRTIAHEEPRKIRDVRPDLRVSLGKVVMRALRNARDQRYGEMQELIDAIATLERDPAVALTPVNPISNTSARGSDPAIQVAAPPPSERSAQEREELGLAATMMLGGPPPSGRGSAAAAVDASAAAAALPTTDRGTALSATDTSRSSKRRSPLIWAIPAALVVLVGVGVVATRGSSAPATPAAGANANGAPPTQTDTDNAPPTPKPAVTISSAKEPATAARPTDPPPVPPVRTPVRAVAPHGPAPVAPPAPRPAEKSGQAPGPVIATPPPAAPAQQQAATPAPPKRPRTSADLEPY